MSAGRARAAAVVADKPDGVATRVDDAIRAINEAKKLNDQLQNQYAVGTAQWHQCESIDDKLYDALAALGN